MKTFCIETSCDDTSFWIVEYKNKRFSVKKLISFSQIKYHNKFGGVVPELASRLHENQIVKLLSEIWIENIKKSDFISFTCCPWLPGSLLVGKALAKSLSIFLEKKIIWVNHIFWHIVAIWIDKKLNDIKFPFVVLTASWWHNDLYIVEKKRKTITLQKIGQTLDDAAWEAFDKVARMLGWPYPWWAWIEQNAIKWKENEKIKLPRVFLKKNNWNFSFSWIKANCLYKIEELKKQFWWFDQQLLYDFCYEFQYAVTEVLAKKLLKAAKFYNIENIAVCGWLSANNFLKGLIEENLTKYNIKNFYTPAKIIYSTDNAAMIWVGGILDKIYKIVEKQ